MSFKIFTYFAQLLLTFWTHSLGVLSFIAACSKDSAQTSELPMFTEPSSSPVSVIQVPASPVEVLPYPNQVSEHHFPESPLSSRTYPNIVRQSPETPTPSFRKKHTRKTHVLFPLVVRPDDAPHENSAVEVTGPSAATTPIECQNTPPATPVFPCEYSFPSGKAEENFTGTSPDTSITSSLDDEFSDSSTPSSLPPATPELPCSPIEISIVVSPDSDSGLSPNDTNGQILRIRDTQPTHDIGNLGKRRGFKGAPLFTAATAKKTTFLEVPLSARNPLASVTNLIKNPSPKSAKQLAINTKQVSPTLQEDFDFNDPFGVRSDSYFVPDVVGTATPYANLYNFSAYQTGAPTRTPTLKRKPAMLDLHSSPVIPAKSKSNTPLTNVYDISIHEYDEPPTKAISTRNRSNTRSREARPHESVEFKLTPPSAPSSPQKGDSPSSLDLDQVQIRFPSTRDTESVHDIMSVLGDYAYYHEDYFPMEPALPDSPVLDIIPRTDMDSTRHFDTLDLGRSVYVDEDGNSVVNRHNSESTAPSIPNTETLSNDGVNEGGHSTKSIDTSQCEIQNDVNTEILSDDDVNEGGHSTKSIDTSQCEIQNDFNTEILSDDDVNEGGHSTKSIDTSQCEIQNDFNTEILSDDNVNEDGHSTKSVDTSQNEIQNEINTETLSDDNVNDDVHSTKSIDNSQNEIQNNSITETLNSDSDNENGHSTKSIDDRHTSQSELQTNSNTEVLNNNSGIAPENSSDTESLSKEGVNHNNLCDSATPSSEKSFSEHHHPVQSTSQLIRTQSARFNNLLYGRSSRSTSHAPKRSSSLRPFFLPMMIARSQNPQTSTRPTYRHSYPNTYTPQTASQKPVATSFCQNADSPSKPPRSYSLPSYWPTPVYRSEATASTASVSTAASSPERRLNALGDILNLLKGADFNVDTKSANAPYHLGSSHSYLDAQIPDDMACLEEGRMSGEGIQPAYAI